MTTEATEQTVVNTELLDKVLDHIEANPYAWEQSSFVDVTMVGACLTNTACLAGHAMILSGRYKTHIDAGGATLLPTSPDYIDPNGDGGVGYYATGKDLLGLTDVQANHLFLGSWHLNLETDAVRGYVTAYLEGPS